MAPQSLPLDAGPASMAAELMSTMPLMSSAAASDAVTDAEAADEVMTPIVVDCAGAAVAPMLAAADCASHWTSEMIGTCDLPHASHGRAATLRRARGPIGGVAVAGRIAEAPELLVPDSHSNPALFTAQARLAPAPLFALLASAAPGDPPAPPSRRLDRPPRA